MRENIWVSIGKMIAMACDDQNVPRIRRWEEMAAVPDFFVSSSAKVIYED